MYNGANTTGHTPNGVSMSRKSFDQQQFKRFVCSTAEFGARSGLGKVNGAPTRAVMGFAGAGSTRVVATRVTAATGITSARDTTFAVTLPVTAFPTPASRTSHSRCYSTTRG